MNELSEIEKLLQSQREVGKVEFDAEFTIDSLRARKKLATSQLPGPGLWLVKLVQAAVAIESSAIKITFGKRVVDFHARGFHWKWDPREIVRLLLSGELSNEPFLFHLLAGLRGSVLEDTVETEWVISDDTSQFHIRFSDEGTQISETHNVSSEESWFRLRTSRPPRWPGLKRAGYMPVGHLIRRTADEFMAVHNYCWASPVPIVVDGKPMECRYRSSPAPHETDPFKLAEQYAVSSPNQAKPTALVRRAIPALKDGPTLHLNWPEGVGKFESIALGETFALLKKRVCLEDTWISIPSENPPGGYLLILFAHQMDSELELYCDGARVDTYPLPWSSKKTAIFGHTIPQNAFKVGLRVMLAVSPQELDLSHFKVRDVQRLFEAYAPVLRELIKESVELCMEHGNKFKFHFAPRPDSRAGKLLSALMSGVVGLHLPMRLMLKRGFKQELKSLLASVNEQK